MMTASYIALDIHAKEERGEWLPTSMIQVMLYQYRVAAKKLPITYLSPSESKKAFETTVNCIEEMWEHSKGLEEGNSSV